MSIAGSAFAVLHKELSSPSATRKIIKPVKSPSPSRRAVAEARVTPEPLPPLFKDVRYQRQFEGGAYAVSEEEFEDWEPQVGPSLCPPSSSPFNLHLRSPTVTHQPVTCSPSCRLLLFLLLSSSFCPSAGFYLSSPASSRHPHRMRTNASFFLLLHS